MLTSILVLIFISQINAYSSGAGFSACDTMHPGHNQESSDTEIPFTLVPNDVKVEVGQVIDLKLSSKVGDKILKGFLVQAFDYLTKVRMGTFEMSADLEGKAMDCGYAKSTATHRNR